MTDNWVGMTPDQLRALRHSPAIVEKITQLAKQLCAAANAIDPTPANKKQAHGPNFAVTVQKDPSTQRPRAYVRPVGKTGLHVEAGHAVLFKAIAAMGGQSDASGPHHELKRTHTGGGIAPIELP